MLNFLPVPERTNGKARISVDLTIVNLDRSVMLVQQLGGRSLNQRHEHDDGTVVVMADPEGNEFCLLRHVA